MQALQADQANFLLHGVYLPGLKNEHRITRASSKPFRRIKATIVRMKFRRARLDLAWHIAATEMRFMEAVAAGEFDFTPRPRPDSIKNSADLSGWYTDNFEPRFEKLTSLTNEQLLKIVDFRGMFQLPAVMYLNFVLHHSIHHRGQLSVYLRPAGGKVPAIYGESYDSAEARKAAQKTA